MPSDKVYRNLKFNDIIRIGILHLVYVFEPLAQFQAQHRLTLVISNDRLRTARPGTAIVQAVEFDALAVNIDLFRHNSSESFIADRCDVSVATTGSPELATPA
jgi:hypothetical protein